MSKYIIEYLDEISETLKKVNNTLNEFAETLRQIKQTEANADNQFTEETKKRGRKPKERKNTDENAETEGLSEHNLEETQE